MSRKLQLRGRVFSLSAFPFPQKTFCFSGTQISLNFHLCSCPLDTNRGSAPGSFNDSVITSVTPVSDTNREFIQAKQPYKSLHLKRYGVSVNSFHSQFPLGIDLQFPNEPCSASMGADPALSGLFDLSSAKIKTFSWQRSRWTVKLTVKM